VATIIHDSYVWDIAAGAALLTRQGGEIRFAAGELVDFSARDLTQPITGLYIAGHPAVVARLIPLIRERERLRRHPAW
jgi:3'-phosphoadenosine 5'-phosphosulfate (PAPS) 3'-phosphatase